MTERVDTIMKGHLISGIKKLAVMLIASVMLLGVVPVSMIAKPTTVQAEGEFLRLFPDAELDLAAHQSSQEHHGPRMQGDVHWIGNQNEAYFRFNLAQLLAQSPETLNQTTLRLTVLQTAQNSSAPIELWLLPPKDRWEDVSSGRPLLQPGQILLSRLTPVQQNSTPSVIEVDLTNYARKWIESGRTEVIFRLMSADTAASVIAGGSYEDPAFRPCLKIVTGAASDPDTQDLTKAWLSAAGSFDPQGRVRKEILYAGNDFNTYMKFTINKKNLCGTIYEAKLQLQPLQCDADTELTLYQLDHTDWTNETLVSGTIPQGKEVLITQDTISDTQTIQLDITDALNDAYTKGATEFAFRLSCAGAAAFIGQGAAAPTLALRVSDDKNIKAAVEAAVYSLNSNLSAENITEDLRKDYTTNDGTRAKLQWQAIDADTGAPAWDVMTKDGQIYRPKWFEENRSVLAKATITSGSVQRQRNYTMVIPPEKAPDYSDEVFDSMLLLGNREQEQTQRFESIAAGLHTRWIGGRNFSYRSLQSDGAMVVNLAVTPDIEQYLTLKLWAEDAFAGILVEDLENPQNKAFSIIKPELTSQEDGFLYVTCPLPAAFTRGRNYVSLRLTIPETHSEKIANLYGIYITQTSYFNPSDFAEQGEVILRKEKRNDTDFYLFLKSLYEAAQKPFTIWDNTEGTAVVPAPVAEETSSQSILAKNGREQLAISGKPGCEAVQIHRDTPFFHSYTEVPVHRYYHDALSAVRYGEYSIFRNRQDTANSIPWQSEHLTGLYQDLSSGIYYVFLHEGQRADTRQLPSETPVLDGTQLVLNPSQNLVLVRLSKPFDTDALKGERLEDAKLTQPQLDKSL